MTPFLDLVFVKNKGISYSLFDQESQTGQIMLAGFAAAASLGLWIWLARAGTGRLMAASLGLIIGGALGNAIDSSCSAASPTSFRCTRSAGTCSTSPTWRSLPGSSASCMTHSCRVAMAPQIRCSRGG